MTVCETCGEIGGVHKNDCSNLSSNMMQPKPESLMSKLYGETDQMPKPQHDPVNHPSHYTQYKGLEIIDLTEQMNFNRGNAVKYIARAGHKAPERTVEDLKKAAWYIDREIKRIEGETG